MSEATRAFRESYELTLELSPEKLKDFARKASRLSVSGLSRASEARSTYFDTQDSTLIRAGVETSLTDVKGRFVQAVEVARGPAKRLLSVENLAGNNPDARTLPAAPWPDRVSRRAKRLRLVPKFDVALTRRAFELSSGASKVELSLDRGVIKAGDSTEEICELRLITDHDTPEPLVAVARDLRGIAELRVLVLRRGLRGDRLLAGVAAQPEKNIHPAFEAAATAQDGAATIFAACLDQLCVNERLFRGEELPEALHQMRVAVRRLRAAVSLLGGVLPPEKMNAAKNELRWLSGLLGHARDYDVLLGKTLKRAQERHGHTPGFEELAGVVTRRRDEAYGALRSAINSPRYFNLMLSIMSLPETVDHSTGGRSANGSFEHYVLREFRRRLRSIRRAARRLEELDPTARHDVRLRAKKLRYMLEFVADAPWSLDTRELGDALQEMQDSLGSLNDAVVGSELMAEIAGDVTIQREAPLALFAAGVVAGDTALDPKPLMKRATTAAAVIRKDHSLRR